jgi:EAL domain-containing protein (putative c-di-GMP-specific phosphodiesterase class I)
MQTDRDVTRERALESELARRASERDLVEVAVRRIDPSATPESIAEVTCTELLKLPSVDSAFVFALDRDGHGLALAAEGALAAAFLSTRAIPAHRARHMMERATDGVWTEDWHSRVEDGTYGERITATGLHTFACAPLRGPTGVIGVVGLGNHADGHHAFVEQLPVLATFASIVGALLAPGLEARGREDDARGSIQAILEGSAFVPFFQPIVELHTGSVVGYEALSRFSNGVAPDVTFGLANRAGLGLELEAATLRVALEASEVLPAATYLSLNASPAFILSGTLRALLAKFTRQVFIEITEHVAIHDYSALRAELAALGATVGVSVDDAGAGFASLHHILELAPDLVKLDISLVRGIDADPARQALIAGMGYFAVKRKLRLIAEGIETQKELEALLKLGIGYGQGYLLGRPADGRTSGPWPSTIPSMVAR